MRVVHVSVSDKDNGAYLAGYRLHHAMLRLGVHSTMFVARRQDNSEDDTIKVYRRPTNMLIRANNRVRRYWISRELTRYTKRKDGPHFVYDRAPEGRRPLSQLPTGEVIYIQTAHGFIDFQALSFLPQYAQIVFVLHDMSFFTGGCAHDCGCGRFTDRCGACPVFDSHSERDVSRRAWERKNNTYSRLRERLHFVAPSRWATQEARRSSLLRDFPIETIPHGVDTDTFRPRDRLAARDLFGIPRNTKVLLYVGQPVDRETKGFIPLVQALREADDRRDLFLLIAGGGKLPVDLPIAHQRVGWVRDERLMSLVYSAADIFVMPSLRETFGMTAVEAMASGIPVVAFATGGITDTVRHGLSGLLVPPGDTQTLYASIERLLDAPSARAQMAANSRRIAVEEYSISVLAKRHAELCARITMLPSLPTTTTAVSGARTSTGHA